MPIWILTPIPSTSKVIIYKSRGELMKHNLKFGLVLGWLAVLKISSINLKYATFEVSFLCFHMQTNEIIGFLYVDSVCTKKLHNLKVITIICFCLKILIWILNRGLFTNYVDKILALTNPPLPFSTLSTLIKSWHFLTTYPILFLKTH